MEPKLFVWNMRSSLQATHILKPIIGCVLPIYMYILYIYMCFYLLHAYQVLLWEIFVVEQVMRAWATLPLRKKGWEFESAQVLAVRGRVQHNKVKPFLPLCFDDWWKRAEGRGWWWWWRALFGFPYFSWLLFPPLRRTFFLFLCSFSTTQVNCKHEWLLISVDDPRVVRVFLLTHSSRVLQSTLAPHHKSSFFCVCFGLSMSKARERESVSPFQLHLKKKKEKKRQEDSATSLKKK